MEHSQLPLTTWYFAIYLMTQSKTNIAALAMMRQLGITLKAAWLLKHKLIEVMTQRESKRPLQGDLSVDDAYLGGERTGGGPGRASSNKVALVAAVEMREGRPQRARFDPVAGSSFAAFDWYRARWEIEMFFHVLKNACKVEAMQLSHIDNLERALALFMVRARRVA